MNNRVSKVYLLALLVCLINLNKGQAQVINNYSNNWIKYDQQYVKIDIEEFGLTRVPFSSLPSDFIIDDVDNLQVFFRGKQISLISTENNEISFYAVPNDGSSDSLLYRPMSARLNVYSSLYSDKSAYFLTSGKEKGKRIEKVIATSNISELNYHMETYVKTFLTEYSFSTEKHAVPSFINSFFELGASRTGERLVGEKMFEFSYQLGDYIQVNNSKPHVKILLHGMFNTSRTLEIYAGNKSDANPRKVGDLFLNGFEGKVFEFELEQGDFSNNGEGSIFIKSNNKLERERFSLAYYSVSFNQKIIDNYIDNKTFSFRSDTHGFSKLNINGLSNDINLYDVSDIYNVREIDGKNQIIETKNGGVTNVFLSKTNILVDKGKCILLKFDRIDPKVTDYIILTNNLLTLGANRYAQYRESAEGGGFRSNVFYIKDIYNQFNYGEVSPVAIRKFVEFMVSDGNRNKSLFLIGKSINPIEKMVKELEDCVPAIGYPASDLLLTTGLSGVDQDVPVIPVGRLMAISDQNIDDYLSKVKQYEKKDSEFTWRKNVLHLSGGHTESEIVQFKGALSNLVPAVEQGPIGGKVIAFSKKSTIEVENVNITSEVNEGVGMLTYFGHGSRTTTDLNFGYASDASKGYKNIEKYPIMYFNGCGVGNAFRGLFNPSPTASDRRPLSMDWTLSKDKGAIVVMANSYESYVSPSLQYLKELYKTMFEDNNTLHLSIGNIQRETAKRVVQNGANRFDISNLHQTVLQGDPEIRFFNLSKPDYVISQDEGIIIQGVNGKTIGDSENLEILAIVSNQGRVVSNEKVPVKIKYLLAGGKEVVIERSIAIVKLDTIRIALNKVKDIRKIEVEIDDLGTIMELNKDNNISVLIVDWDVAKNQFLYPIEKLLDIISPIMSVTFNGETIVNGQQLTPNPTIRLVLSDDRYLSRDTSLVDIFIKNCLNEDCDFVKLNLNDNLVQIRTISNSMMEIIYSPDTILSGDYELLISAKDLKNNTVVKPYRIRFKVAENKIFEVVASPNPASSYLLFSSNFNPEDKSAYINFKVYDVLGQLLEDRNVHDSNQWYWYPNVASGVYYSKSILIKDGVVIDEKGQKVVIVR